MPSYLKKTSNKKKIPRNKNRSIVSPPMKRKAKKKLAETDKGSYYCITKMIKTCSDNLGYKNLFKVSKLMIGQRLLDVVLMLFSDFEHVFVQ